VAALGHIAGMRLRSLALASLALTLGVPLTACAPRTTIEHVWHAPDWTGSFTHVLVMGMSQRAGLRRDFETKMVAAFANVGVRATPAFHLFPEERELQNQEITQALEEYGIDAILVTRLVGIDRQHRYVAGSPYAVVGGPRHGFYGYYHWTYGVLYSPGYVVNYDIVTIETNLYDAASSELIWSGLSETFDPQTIDQTIASYSQTMVTALLEGRMVTRTVTPGAIEIEVHD
jgi:hypothetical protein